PYATLPVIKRAEARNSSCEETAGRRPRLRGTQAEMPIGRLRRDPPARGALQEPGLDQIRLDDVLDRAPFLADGDGETLDADRPAVEALDDREQQLPVHRVETVRIDLEHVHRGLRDGRIDLAVRLDLRVVAHAPDEPVRDAGRAART